MRSLACRYLTVPASWTNIFAGVMTTDLLPLRLERSTDSRLDAITTNLITHSVLCEDHPCLSDSWCSFLTVHQHYPNSYCKLSRSSRSPVDAVSRLFHALDVPSSGNTEIVRPFCEVAELTSMSSPPFTLVSLGSTFWVELRTLRFS